MYSIIEYKENMEYDWDEFVLNQSINGNFLQSRKFLNYHPKGRFEDCSILFYYKEELVAVCPACVEWENEKKIFHSHKGSTYGGIVISKRVYRTEKLLELIKGLEDFLKKKNFNKIIMKPSMNLLSNPSMDLMYYCLGYLNYREYKELNIYINYQNYNPDIISNLSKMKQRIIRKCIKENVQLKKLNEDCQIGDFHEILEGNLKKYNKKPVHSYEELLDLKNKRFSDEIVFWGVYLDEKLVAGTMVFEFPKYGCAHTQYLAADLAYNKLSPMSFLYYKMAEYYFERKFRYLSWGISTEDLGRYINMGLTNNKEEYGSEHNLIAIYEKDI